MIGRKNIIFGFLFLVLTAALGPYMVKGVFPVVGEADAKRKAQMSELALAAESGFEKDLAPMTDGDIARSTANALVAVNAWLNARAPVDAIKGGPHAHGNLEALLNIAAGIVLIFLTVPVVVKQLISWLFILGTLLHSGLLYLAIVFEQPLAWQLLGYGLGPILLLIALLLAGAAAALGFRAEDKA